MASVGDTAEVKDIAEVKIYDITGGSKGNYCHRLDGGRGGGPSVSGPCKDDGIPRNTCIELCLKVFFLCIKVCADMGAQSLRYLHVGV